MNSIGNGMKKFSSFFKCRKVDEDDLLNNFNLKNSFQMKIYVAFGRY